MRPPSDEFRALVAERTEEIDTEEQLDELLEEIERQLGEASAETAPTPQAEHAAVLAWASIVSFAVARLYAPASPRRFSRLAGWDPKIGARLEKLGRVFRPPMLKVLKTTGAESFSIEVGFPWGITVGLSWSK